MTYKKGNKSYFKRKQAHKKNAKTKMSLTVPKRNVKIGSGLPERMCVKQKYVDTITLTSTSGTIYNYLYCLNGLYDTDHTGTGHQPMYFDTFMAIYNHYTVIGCKMSVKFISQEANTVPINCILWRNDDSVITPTSMNSYAEQNVGKQCVIADGAKSTVLTLQWSPKRVHGPVLANTLLRGNISSNPTETTYGVISVQSADQLSSTSVTAQITLEYITVYTEFRDSNGS